jgi:hypothetical protein
MTRLPRPLCLLLLAVVFAAWCCAAMGEPQIPHKPKPTTRPRVVVSVATIQRITWSDGTTEDAELLVNVRVPRE